LTSILQVSAFFNLLSPIFFGPEHHPSRSFPPPNPWIPGFFFPLHPAKMKRPTLLTPLFLHLLLLSVSSASAVCNDQTARPIDGEILVLISVEAAFINEVGLLIAGAAVKRRNAVPVQIRDVFSCTRLIYSIHSLILGWLYADGRRGW
jgi:hypothetical protein